MAISRPAIFILALIALAGCTAGPSYWAPPGAPSAVVYYDNPMLVTGVGAGQVWEKVVDVVDDYFEIAEEIPVSDLDDVGQLTTVPQIGSTLLEPWRHDSANFDEKLESTLQTIRRQAVIHVARVEHGYLVEVNVYKYLEDPAKPMQSTGETSLLRYDSSLVRVENPVPEQPIDEGWIPLGRDTALEQRILGQLQACRPIYLMQ